MTDECINGTTMHGNKSVMLIILNEKFIKVIKKLKVFHQVKKKTIDFVLSTSLSCGYYKLL